MEQILVRVHNKEKAKVLYELLTSLDFVDSVKTIELEETEPKSTEELADFFAMAGLWQGRDVTEASIRQQAWPRLS